MTRYILARNLKTAITLFNTLEDHGHKTDKFAKHKVPKGYKLYMIEIKPMAQCADGFITQDIVNNRRKSQRPTTR